MKTFEEKHTAWLDGALTSEEASAFEKEHASIAHEKGDFMKLKTLLQQNLQNKTPENPDFFNSQIMAQIQSGSAPRGPAVNRTWFGLPQIAWGGILVLSTGFVLFFTIIPRGDISNSRSGYAAEVLETKTSDPKVRATVDAQKDMTIIKLDGLRKVPTDQKMNQ
jgi:hypothetical protein